MTNSNKVPNEKVLEMTMQMALGQFPDWAQNLLGSFEHLRDIDKIDKILAQLPPEETAKLLKELPKEVYQTALDNMVHSDSWKMNSAKLASLLRINGMPFTLARHRFFEPLFYPDLPPKTLLVCGRQVGKSTHMAAQGVIQASSIPRFKALFLAPQFEQIRRFSHQYIRQFIHESWINPIIMGKGSTDSVLHKMFSNYSELWFSFALLSVDRVRGLSVDAIRVDEVQDLQPDFLDIIRECMSSSEYRSEIYTGTSKTKDNLIEILRLQSSQAEWLMKCEVCNFWNVPTLEGQGEGLGVGHMLQPEGLGCAKCRRLLNPEKGIWVHKYTEKATTFPSYHVPQVIVPVHYANKRNWQALLLKRDTMSPASFTNEVLGEACDEGARLVSLAELKAAATLSPNSLETAINTKGRYVDRIVGIDWGGKGEQLQSLTAIAAVGVNPASDILDVFYGYTFPPLLDPVRETKEAVALYSQVSASCIAHDAAVAGEIRKSIMRDIGVPEHKLINCRYSGNQSTKQMIVFKPADPLNPANYYSMDKSRVVAAVCLAIRAGKIRFPQYESMGDSSGRNLLEHFLAVYEELVETAHGGEKKFIKRNAGMPDDFLHAVAFAVCTAWYRYPSTKPNLSDKFFDPITQKELNHWEPLVYDDWDS